MQKIQVLSPQLVAKIAAGEVVERPASVVKELIENSIDAGATNIELHVKEAGKSLIELRDNGSGMCKDDAILAFKQHATSKIGAEADLSAISTLGFRGEALSSISAVADIELETGDGKESTSVRIINQTLKTSQGKIGQGTIIKVMRLFSRVPARKKFLRSESTEYKHISEVFIQHALANPEINFKFFSNTKQVYNLPSTKNLATRIFDIWGNRYKDKLIEINFDSPQIGITGLLTPPEEARRNRSAQYLFLNKRPISSNLVTKAIEDAFHSTHPDKKYPGFFIFLTLDPQSVDVNVHPRKLEVKFGNTRTLYNAVKHASEYALSSSLQNTVKQQFEYENITLNHPKRSILSEKTVQYQKGDSSKPKSTRLAGNFVQGSLNFSQALLKPSKKLEESSTGAEQGISYKASQFFNTYIVIEREGKLLFIDQHAADERINYEKIMKSRKLETQSLLTPEIMELTPAEFEILKERHAEFAKLGIVLEPFGKNTVKLVEKPAILKNFDFQSFIEEILAENITNINEKKVLHRFVATLACHSSIRAGRKMHQEEIDVMIKQLFECDKPYSCPHGRPIIWELSKNELEKNFKRTGF